MRIKSNWNILEKIELTGLNPDEVEVYSWPQMWGNTNCGFGGIAGRAMTKAQTIIIRSIFSAECYVFIADTFAYKTSFDYKLFYDAWQKMSVPGKKDAEKLGIVINEVVN